MARRVFVAPQVLQSKASVLRGLAQRYRQACSGLFAHVATLQGAWDGPDHAAFITQVEGFRGDLDDTARLIEQIAEYLEGSASMYGDVQKRANDLASKM